MEMKKHGSGKKKLVAVGGWRGGVRLPVRLYPDLEAGRHNGRIGGNEPASDRERLQAIRTAIQSAGTGMDEIILGEG